MGKENKMRLSFMKPPLFKILPKIIVMMFQSRLVDDVVYNALPVAMEQVLFKI